MAAMNVIGVGSWHEKSTKVHTEGISMVYTSQGRSCSISTASAQAPGGKGEKSLLEILKGDLVNLGMTLRRLSTNLLNEA